MLRQAFILLIVCAVAIGLIKGGMQFSQGQQQELPLARVHKQYLYRENLLSAHSKPEVNEMSSQVRDKYVQDWVLRKLLVAEAEAKHDCDRVDLERRVLDYRHTLLIHHFLEKQVSAQLNKEVSEEAIDDYYKAHRDSLLLHTGIFKGKVVVIPRKSPHRAQLVQLLRTNTKAGKKALMDYCSQFAENCSLEGDTWLLWEKLIKETSLNERRDKSSLLRKGKLLQARDKNYFYYFKIDECFKAGEVPPLEFIRPKIVTMILHQRKADIIVRIKQEVLKKAKDNNNCVIYEQP